MQTKIISLNTTMNTFILFTTILIAAFAVYTVSGETIGVDGRNYYISIPQEEDWYQANRYCAALGMYLVDFRTESEYHRVMKAINQYNIQNTPKNLTNFWTSGTDLGNEGQFWWFTTGQTLVYYRWAKPNPDNKKNAAGETENCLASIKGDWEDMQCSDKYPFICRDTFDVTNYKSFGCAVKNSY